MIQSVEIRKRDRDMILQALRTGVVPKTGLHLIQVGRKSEVEALISDIDRIADQGSSIRFVIGPYGSGKTFFLNLVRTIALEKGLVTASADLSPSRRIFSSSGQARSLYVELVRNLATRTKSGGGALPGIVEKFIASSKKEAKARSVSVETVIFEKLEPLTELVGGFDFAEVVSSYYRGFEQSNDELKQDAIRWLRGEFSTKTDARLALGVRTIVDDSNYYDFLKLLAKFISISGYSGLFITIDEMVNVYKMANTIGRNNSYEQILRIVNDCLQGDTEDIGFVFGGTPEFFFDTRRGIFSYEALRSRLAINPFSDEILKDYTSPVIELESLSPEDLYVLLGKLNFVFASGDIANQLLPEEAYQVFMGYCNKTLGSSYYRTPRNTIKSFIDLLAILDQNKDAHWEELIGGLEVQRDTGGVEEQQVDIEDDDELTTFKL